MYKGKNELYKKCELTLCKSGQPATVHANENIEDASYHVLICERCAKALGVENWKDLPDPEVVRKKLAIEYVKKRVEIDPEWCENMARKEGNDEIGVGPQTEEVFDIPKGLRDPQRELFTEPILDAEGENQPLRVFLTGLEIGAKTVGAMRNHMDLSGWANCWPEFIERENEDSHLTKSGKQLWIRYLLGLETNEQTKG
jgi:hypothetical protein